MVKITTKPCWPVSARGQQCGQVLLLALLLMLGGTFMLVALFSGGQVLATRQRLVGAADAAALSAATWRARVLNTIAYTNRAIVAQEVSIAQAVTLASWARYFESLAGNAEMLAQLYPPAAPLLASINSVARTGREATELAAGSEQQWRGAADLGDKIWLARSQEWLLRSADVFALGALANEVARAADSRFFAFALGDSGAFSRFAKPQNTDDTRARLKEVVLESLDRYTAEPRAVDHRLLLPSSCVGRSADLDRWTLWLRRRGGTSLHGSLETWSAIDTASLHDWRPRGFLGLGGCADRESLPLGWGREGASLPFTAAQAETARVNPAAVARSGSHPQAGAADLAGLPTIHDLASLDPSNSYVSRVAVLARVDAKSVATVDRLGIMLGRVRLREGNAPERLWALSAAEVYFSAPPESGTAPQRPSLFSPFWQARLSAASAGERAAAQTYVR